MPELASVFEESARANESEYDCLMLLSGGKDSTYALCRLVEMGLSVYAFTLDNGFIADGAKENIRRVADMLGVPVEFATTPAMNAIFHDSLMRFANVCNGCFKTIYTLSMQRARQLGIPIIVTGLSRGQMFETRLTEEMFRDGRLSPEEVDSAVLAARKAYHRIPDEVARSLDVGMFEDDRIFEQVRFIDFYRYCDVGMDEMLSYLKREVPWVRPQDTGRSTNCLINDVGIYVHNRERGFHNYALPYSWDVRLGHKERDAALAELDDEIDVDFVRRTLAELGYDEERLGSTAGQTTLEAFFVAAPEVSEEQIRRRLGERLPPQLIPARLQRVDSIPLTTSGKIDEAALSRQASTTLSRTPYRAPAGPVQEYLAGVWQQELGAERVGADDSFFELGGTSLSAMQVMLRLCREFDIDLPLAAMFSHQTLAAAGRGRRGQDPRRRRRTALSVDGLGLRLEPRAQRRRSSQPKTPARWNRPSSRKVGICEFVRVYSDSRRARSRARRNSMCVTRIEPRYAGRRASRLVASRWISSLSAARRHCLNGPSSSNTEVRTAMLLA